MADQTNEAAKRQLAEDKKLREVQDKQRAEAAKGRPTPTQEEADLILLGANPELSEDGSGPDPHNFSQTRQVEAGKPGAYQTRASAPAGAHRRGE